VVLVFGVLAAPALGQGPTKLKWKFKEGDKFYVEDISNLKEKIELMGKPIEQKQKTTMVTSYKVTKVDSDSTTLISKIEEVKVQSEGGLSSKLDEVMEKLKGATFTITLDKSGKITKFEGYGEFIKKLVEGMEDIGKYVKAMITEDVLKQSAEEAFGFLPPDPVSKDAKWKRENTIPFGPLGSFKAANEYTYLGMEDGLAKIGLKANLKYYPPKGDQGFSLFKITRGNLKSEGARGTLFFDPEKGRLAKYSMAMIFRGALTLDVMGQMIDVDVTIDQSSNSRVMDRNPLSQSKE
jgi:hypothetical protein